MSGSAAVQAAGASTAQESGRAVFRMRASLWAWIAVALILAGVALVRVRLLDLPPDRDEGEYAYFGQLLLRGIPPYAAAYNFKMPGIYAVYAAILAAFGQTPTAVHVGLLLANAIAIVLMLALGRRVIGTLGGVVAAAAYATLTLSPRLLSSAAYAEHFVVVPALLGVLVLTRADGRPRPATLLGAGLLFGAAFLVKQSGGVFALFGLVYALTGAPEGLRRRLGAAMALAAGAVAPYAALCLLLLVAGTFGSFWFWTFTYAYHYGTGESLRQGATNLGNALGLILPTCYLAVALSALGLSAVLWDPVIRARFKPIGLLLLCGVVATSAGLYFRHQYFILLLPGAALLAGLAVDAVSRHSALRPAPALRAAVAIVLAAVPLLHLVYLERGILFVGTTRQVGRALYGMNPFPEAVEIGKFLKERTADDDRVAVVGSEPEIYFYAARRGATGYVYTYPMMDPQPYAVWMQREMIREIEAGDPRFVVFVRFWYSWLPRPDSNETIFHWFEDYKQRFDLVGVVDILSPGQTRYLWGEAAAAYTPVTDRWLAVYERREARRANERTRP